ncbi:hypothetical protein [Terrisporobacter petrolearius]|uniref:hypothetical protein n=1 Tax=Terrisporobacter petrolearius TaxID=1460447 RepID=UPI0031CC4189
MKIINNILKILVYLVNLFFILIYLLLVGYSLEISLDGILIVLVILEVLYIYLTYLFYKNTSLNKKNDYKIIIVVTISIIIAAILSTFINKSILTMSFFLFHCLPYIILIISMQFNKLCMKKLKN